MDDGLIMRDNFFSRTLYATAPLLLWAAHFTLCYALVAMQCSPALLSPGAPTMWILALASIAALGTCALMLWRAKRTLNEQARLLDWARTGSALLALTGIAWTSVPLLLLDGCG
jgi:hypothetical protein